MRFPPRQLTPLASALASFLVLSCGGDNLVLPSEGTAASIAVVSGNNQQGTVGAPLTDSLRVRVLDKASRPVPDQPVSWTVVAGGGSILGNSTTDADGRAAASWTLGSGAGTQQVEARPTGNGAPDNLQAVFSAIAGAASASNLIKVSGDSQTAVAGSPLSDSLVVRVTDAASNAVAGVNVAWAVTGGGAVSAAATPTGADGRAAVSRTLGAAAGRQTTTASVTGLAGSPIVFVATATVGSAGRLVIMEQPSSSAASGVAFPRQPTIQIQDANGNPVSLAGIAVAAAMASNPGGGALIGNSTATTDGAGLATFQNLGISGPAGSYTLNFSVPNRSDISGTPPSSAITISAGSATRLRFSVQPSSITAGGTITPAVAVRVEDALGNLVNSATTPVTVGLGVNSGGATLSGTRTVNAVGGIATFTDLSLNRPGTGYTLTASASGLSGTASNPFNVTTGTATQIAANSQTAYSATAGTAVSPNPSVIVTDGNGNPVAGVNVTFTVTQGGGSVTGSAQTTNASGIATVGSWTLGTTAGTNSLTASASGLAGSPVTFTATATVGTAEKLFVSQQPSTSPVNGEPFIQQPQIQLQDAGGNPVTTGGIAVKAEFAASQAGATLDGNTTAITDNGRATFTDLGITGVVGSYSLKFSVPNRSDITGATSGTITLLAGPASKITSNISGPISGTAGGPASPTPSVLVTDESDNPVSGVNVTFAVTSGGGNISGSGDVQTGSDGIATVGGWTLGSMAGANTLTATATGLTGSPVTFTATASAGAASQVQFEQQPSNVTAGGSITPAVTVRIEDAYGNLVTSASSSVTVTIGANPGAAALGGTLTAAASSGIATFADLTLDKTGTGYTLVVSSGSLANDVSDAFDVAAGAATKLAFGQQPTAVTAGAPISPTVTVLVEDALGNIVTSATDSVTLSLVSNPGSGTLGGTTGAVAVGGVVTFPGLTVDMAGVGYTLGASALSLTAVESAAFDVSP